ncbi:unnamed protein product [Rotaria socialis]|uniref:Peptidase S1 domain-containing protein n=2 Tax=Rotaria socialis TaxID=392032 RepID=A0A818S4A9_9BILA|nr:unnamed protein product [Rotaria socialis]CAF3663958.1 unnamed protein product [Rotaria socialis]
MFVQGIILFILLNGLMAQTMFDPASFTQNSCTNNNEWTTWFDSSDPNFTQGENEITKHIQQLFPGFMCPDPIAIEAQTVTDGSPTQTGDVIRLTKDDGFMCLNQMVTDFKTKLCADYKVRYCCPTSSIGKPTIQTIPPVISTTRPTIANTCGRQVITPSYQRIVGGTEAVAHSWPWIVSLQSRDHFCGGTLIDNRHVVTAAHCIDSTNFRVIAGLHQRTNINGPRSQILGVQRVFVHEQYNKKTEANDIALVRLAQPAQFNDYVGAICLPGPDPQESERVTVAGWGVLSENGNSASSLRQVTVNVMNNQAQQAYRNSFDVRQQIGAGIPNIGGKDSCQGDSGGPLMYNANNQWYLSGVVSFGDGCGAAKYPGIYTRTSAYLTWLRSKMNTP